MAAKAGAGGIGFAEAEAEPPLAPIASGRPDTAGERYPDFEERSFVAVADDPRSTFSVDVDTASYANVRRYLRSGTLPPPEAVRTEELVNYFDYDYPEPTNGAPFAVVTEVGPAPWRPEHRLVHIGLQAKKIDLSRTPPRNLVFLLDVSGSMESPDKLPLLKSSLAMLVDGLRPADRIGIVVYAGASGVVLEPTNDRAAILEALESLHAGGSTNGAGGIEAAYALARQSFVPGGINRVILATDGDFNVGPQSPAALRRLIEKKRKDGIFLSVLGFGTGNLQDRTMQVLAQHGNGNAAYIDSLAEARKVLVEEAGGTLVTVAKDVKIQVEFNPLQVAAYRLIGYETRHLEHRDFNDDRKDAGDIGAGHTVTALYEIVPASRNVAGGTDPLKYQRPSTPSDAARSGELLTVRLRYKHPRGTRSRLLEVPVRDDERPLERTSNDFRFSAAVAEFAMLLHRSPHAGRSSWQQVVELAQGALGADRAGRRREFVTLARTAATLR
ncbi:MAG: VWA domain-containing protein [Deltaproteobacteria bacterium]|nr:MAG: VWA domain-containing protein [Deltaproteobacteria bacterium]